MSTYEIVAIVRPDLDEEALTAAIERIHQRIAENGGTVKSADRWGKRKLAYPIQNHRDGFYLMTVFELDSGRVGPLRQTLGLHEALLRFTVATHRIAAPAAAGASSTAAPAGHTSAAGASSAAAPAGHTSTAGTSSTAAPAGHTSAAGASSAAAPAGQAPTTGTPGTAAAGGEERPAGPATGGAHV